MASSHLPSATLPIAANDSLKNYSSTSLLNPIERISEILFGLIMALTFTCTISIADADKAEVKTTLIAALGCNIAWGLVDAVMYLLAIMTERGRNKIILNFVRNTTNTQVAREYISDALPPMIASVTSDESLETIRMRLKEIPEENIRVRLTGRDFKIALGIFLLVFISTLPVAIPFMIVKEVQPALRISNLVAIVLMFICGWFLARYGGYNKLITSLILVVIGVALVGLTISLGG
jgi:VIT1/CCC1 family predicted Fe2+/Mn2+ transporter